MAEIRCPECNTAFDDSEQSCPCCGYRFPDKSDESAAVHEKSSWHFGNTLVLLFMILLIGVGGALLYLNMLKWPYEDAVDYFNAEKEAYEQQIAEYREAADAVAEANTVLDAKMSEINALLDSGLEPIDPDTAMAARESIQAAQEARIEPPVIEADSGLPVLEDNSVFRWKEIQEAAKIIDQQRFELYRKYADVMKPDYTAVMEMMNRAEQALKESIRQRQTGEGVTPELKQIIDEYETFMMEYCEFMKEYDRSDPEMIHRAEALQTEFMYQTNRIRELKPGTMSETDRNYFLAVTAGVAKRLEAISRG